MSIPQVGDVGHCFSLIRKVTTSDLFFGSILLVDTLGQYSLFMLEIGALCRQIFRVCTFGQYFWFDVLYNPPHMVRIPIAKSLIANGALHAQYVTDASNFAYSHYVRESLFGECSLHSFCSAHCTTLPCTFAHQKEPPLKVQSLFILFNITHNASMHICTSERAYLKCSLHSFSSIYRTMLPCTHAHQNEPPSKVQFLLALLWRTCTRFQVPVVLGQSLLVGCILCLRYLIHMAIFPGNCAHWKEPDCAVKQAVEDGLVAQSRLDAFHELRGLP